MNNWFKRLFGLEHEEDEHGPTGMLDQEIKRPQQSSFYKSTTKEARVVYDYPKGQFRFPLIPDENNQSKTMSNRNANISSQRMEEQRFNESWADSEYSSGITRKEYRSQGKERSRSRDQSQKRDQGVNRESNQSKSSQSSASKSYKSPFKPTEVPSPIYGFKRPEPEQQEPILNHEEVSATVEVFDIQDTIEESSSTIIEEDVHEEPIIPEQIVVKEEENEKEEALELAVSSEIIETVIPDDEMMIETVTETKEESRKRHGVPFNVMMLKQDRESIKETPPINESQQPKESHLNKPPLSLLDIPPLEVEEDEEWLHEQSRLLDHAFESFNVGAKVVKATKGPAVTQFEVQPDMGVRVNKITNLSDDLKLALAAKDIRIEAPIPGKSTVGIEVPNRKSRAVLIREILRSPVFQSDKSPLVVALGLDISGQPIVTDLKKMPHGLIAGATGSGKSVCINSIIISLLYKASPHEVKLMLIDPKMVELAPYNGIPHLVSPVITDVKAATAALKWAVEEMERRYELFAHEGVRDISRFNEKVQQEDPKAEIMPYLVIIIDELADLMMVSAADVEDAICRIAQKARACGIHLLLATQRPSVDVITGLIKANVPTRIAFSVSSQVDSRTIIDISGAEKLLGRGDMLFLENGSNKPVRIQGNFVKDEEIERVTHFVRKQMKPNYLFVQEELIKQAVDYGVDDELFEEACQFVIEQEGASASSLQRRFRIGYNRAARLVDMMEAQGIVSEAKGSKPREVLVSKEQLENNLQI
ncbi:MAG TPA: DNA translocase FtsK [Bacillales bacterium]|nr:DNA translocase FtsK [Bacillales bacterium]